MNCRPKDVPTIFDEALEIAAPAEREAYLDRVCGDDVSLRRQVDQMLDDHAQAGDFLEEPALIVTHRMPQIDDGFGSMIGPYKLREQLGEGGMGVVYVAEQERPVRRKVAIKVIKPGMDSRDVIARFEAERQALALMDHPNIAKVLDAGTTQDSNRPYFVMELVRGISITDYCDKVNLKPRERLKLFIQVCQAVQHAHQKGVIHRDLKPSNVLVTLHDGIPVPKVIDFGVAKAINQRLTEHTVYTRLSQMVGTPLYMSPEQAELSGLDVDTRSDVYSLGVLLYELLAGTTPFDKEAFSKVGLDEMRRMIREVEPQRPSQRISTLDINARSTVSGKRGIDERNLTQELRGELDWIVMKALEKDRQQRYESASAFAADVQRYLDSEPVEACPPSTAYRLRKYARKHRTVLLTGVIVTASLVLGTAFSTWQALEATSARKLADDRLTLANDRFKNEQKALSSANEQRELAYTNLQQALDAVDRMLMRVADERLAGIPGAEPVRHELFNDALTFYGAFLKKAPDDPQLKLNTAKAWSSVAGLHNQLSHYDEARTAWREAINRWKVLHLENQTDPEILRGLAEAKEFLATCAHYHGGKIDEAELEYEEALGLWRQLSKLFPDNFDYRVREPIIETRLGSLYLSTNRTTLGENILRRAIDEHRRLENDTDLPAKYLPGRCWPTRSLASYLAAKSNSEDEARQLFRDSIELAERAFRNDSQNSVNVWILCDSETGYADFLESRGQNAEAEPHYRRAVECAQNLLRNHPVDLPSFYTVEADVLPGAQLSLANLLARDGRHAEAIILYRNVFEYSSPRLESGSRANQRNYFIKKAQQELFKSFGLHVGSASLDEVRRTCEAMSQIRGTGPNALLSPIFAARTWKDIGETDRGKQVFNEIIGQLERETSDPHWPADRLTIVQQLLETARKLDIEIGRDSVLAAGISAAIDQPVDFAPRDIGAYQERGLLHATLGQISRARRDFESAINAINAGGQAGCHERYQQALCYLRINDKEKYRAVASEMQARFQGSQDAKELYWTVWTCILGPDALDDYGPLVEMASRGAPPTDVPSRLALGAALFRSGQFEKALSAINECESTTANSNLSPMYTWYFLAMTHHKLGHDADARKWFDQAQAETTRILANGKTETGETLSWNRRLTLELLHAEAKALLAAPLGDAVKDFSR